MNITLSIDDAIVKEARRTARAMGTSLNQLVRDYLTELTQRGAADADVAELEALSDASAGRSRGWRFDRDELHERS